MNKLVQQITERLNQVLSDLDVVVEKVTLTRGKNPLVVVDIDKTDGPGAVEAKVIEQATRIISTEMDEIDPFPTAYTLEVGTPGAERDLRTPRHFRRTIGRPVKMKLREGGRVSGIIRDVTDTDVVLDVMGAESVIPLEAIASARSRVDLSRTEE